MPSDSDATAKSSPKTTLPSSSSSKGEQGETSQQKGDRKQAGEDLQKAGEQIAKAGEKLGSQAAQAGADSQQGEAGEEVGEAGQTGGSELPPLFEQEPTLSASDEPLDTLLPPPDDDEISDSDELIFDEEQAETASASQATDAAQQSESEQSTDASASQDMASSDASSDSSEGSESAGGLQIEIIAAQEALEAAGEALQKAGEAVANAESDADLEAAEQLLSRARISIIIATEDLKILQQSDAENPSGDSEGLFGEIEATLGDANVMLVIATQAILQAKTGLPDFPDGMPSMGIPTGGTEVGLLDEELEESLLIFEGTLEDARDIAINTTAPPAADGGTRARVIDLNQGIIEIPAGQEKGEPDFSDDSGDSANTTLATAPLPDDIPSAQGDDIVAQQLREAAIAETDPELKEKLWDEYKRYKSGL